MWKGLGNIPISRWFLGDTFKVFTINQALDTFLYHVDVREETCRQLREDFVHELGMNEFLALSKVFC